MTDLTLSAIEAMADRFGLHNASTTNGLVAAKLHRVRQALDTAALPSLKAFDEAHRRHAKQQDGEPIALQGRMYLPAMTQAYEADPAQVVELNEAITPILTESLTVSVTQFTESDIGWITTSAESEAERAAFGAALARYTVA